MKAKIFQRVVLIVLALIFLICFGALAWDQFGLGDRLKTTRSRLANPVPTVAPATQSTPAPADQLSEDIASHFTFIGYKDTAKGKLMMWKYSGGYVPALDPYAYEFDKKLNPTAYGIKIEGDTTLDKIGSVVLRYALSPEELTHFRVQMAMPGTEILASLAIENEYANWLRTQLTPEQYDAVVNETLTYFYERFWDFETSTDWVLENILIDEVSGRHDDSRLKGRLSSDDKDKDLLVTFKDKTGKNFISSTLGFQNTYRDAGATYTPTDERAWIDLDEGGTWKWKTGSGTGGQGGTPTTPTNPPVQPTPSPPPTDPPVVPHKDPSENPQDPIWSGPLTPGHDTDPYEPTEPARPAAPSQPQPSQPEPERPPAAVVQPPEDCNHDGSTADEQAAAVREDLQPAPAPVIDTVTDTHPAQAPTAEVAAQPEVPAVAGGFSMPAIDD